MRRSRAGRGRRSPSMGPLGALAVLILLGGCTRGSTSGRPPIHLNPNMDDQPKAEAQEASAFFADGAVMRRPVAGTVARGDLHEDPAVASGSLGGVPVAGSPMAVDEDLLARGAERYAIYCGPCHGERGDGQSMLRERSGVATADLLQERLRTVQDGYLFDVITNGLGLMPGYAYQIPVEDRWAIVAHVRTLQRAGGPVEPTATGSSGPEEPGEPTGGEEVAP